MAALAAGDRSVFDAVYASVWPLLQSFANRALSDHHAAEDVAQQTLIKVFSRASEFDENKDALSWITGIAAYECKTFRKKTQRRKEAQLDPEGPNILASPSPEQRAIDEDLACAIREILGELSELDAKTLKIAALDLDREGIKGATFRKRLQRALSRLKSLWGAKHGTE